MRWSGRIAADGSFEPDSRAQWRAAMVKRAGQRVYVEVTRQQTKATQDQHGYYRGPVLRALCEAWGWGDPAELHYALKLHHLPAIIPIEEWPARRIGRELVIEPPSHADLDVEQFRQYLDLVLAQAADDGVIVPPPTGQERILTSSRHDVMI
jgi:hypothetical protein